MGKGGNNDAKMVYFPLGRSHIFQYVYSHHVYKNNYRNNIVFNSSSFIKSLLILKHVFFILEHISKSVPSFWHLFFHIVK